MRVHVICTVIAVMLGLAGSTSARGTLGSRLSAVLVSSPADSAYLVWITFADKGTLSLEKLASAEVVTERALQRRLRVLPPGALLDESDLPVEESYVAQIEALGARARHRSRWLNAVSARATAAQIASIAALPFVRDVELVGRYKRSTPPPSAPEEPAVPPRIPKTSGPQALDYGPSLNQLLLINVPPLHESGNSAQGVIVGVFDDGFRLPTHEAFASMNVLATYDFVDNKVSVVPDSSWLGDHGVNTLSTIGGYKPGQLIGPAFGASFILARTENTLSETPLEEDNWVRAIEWADSLGVQVTSTSLGYLDYNPGYTSWTWENMDGRTTVISRAAAMAVRKGILVVNSAGNEGYNPTRNTLTAPADADSVVAAGAVDLSGKRAAFSSVGPSTALPPRIKPDLMAPGVSMYVASAYNATGYTSGVQGTSFACPLVAGVAALLVKAYPDAPPMKIVGAMKATASQSSAPDNLMGWGIVNALAAFNHLAGIDTMTPPLTTASYVLRQNYPNPFNLGTQILYSLPAASSIGLTIHDILGREVRTLAAGDRPAGAYAVQWDGRDNRGMPVATGTYVCRLTAVGAGGAQSVLSTKMLLLR